MTLLGLLLGLGVLGYFLLQTGAGDAISQVFTMKLTAAQIAQYASNAGFTGDDLATATAIAIAESGGDPTIQGDWTLDGKIVPKGTPGAVATSIGLWQIHFTVHPEYDPQSLLDPQYNASAAFDLFTARGNFNDWSTYGNLPGHNNAYAKYLDQATQASEGLNA